MSRLAVLIMLALITSSCAFIGAGEIGDVVYKSPPKTSVDTSISFNVGYYIDDTWLFDFLKSNPDSIGRKVITPATIENLWGKPNKVVIEKDRKIITYNRGLRWNGFIAIVLIPIPIAVPVGHKTVIFTFENDLLTYWVIRDNHYCISYTGFNLIPFDPEGKTLGFHATTECQWHKDISPRDGEMACGSLFYDKCYPPNSGAGGTGINLK